MRLRVVGCSPAWPNPGGAQSGYLVEADGRRLLLDCGPGVLPRLRQEEPWPRLDAIVITHFHLDHWGDLVPWAFGGLFGAGSEVEPPELWLPHGGRETVHGLDPVLYANAILELFSIHEYEEGTPFRAAGFEVVAYRMLHYALESYGLRVANGTRTLAYSADSAPCDGLVELARDADLFLCEATLSQPEHGLRGHLTADEAIEAHDASGAKRLVIIHRPNELPLPEGVERAHDGLELDV
ncbi:MAG TPA: MBL fold metallo-hydrolase [Gaiellaceae bacterium]|nr:MBL fold metallo-hydrolase [Gaiellaceae bacterium]